MLQPTLHYPQAPQQLPSNLPQPHYLFIPPFLTLPPYTPTLWYPQKLPGCSVTIFLETSDLPGYVQHPSPISNQSQLPSVKIMYTVKPCRATRCLRVEGEWRQYEVINNTAINAASPLEIEIEKEEAQEAAKSERR
ncbi:hypothetical protein LENED_009615 [Lentinula edodes]|uniref:Uncharacterized protein n=1 Tax=Lentinula edodes TaxID=5353 RepID=A0A1Q3EK77_LENED|nr:hypothetical protein LENED_009615 [Lentinula edodes]